MKEADALTLMRRRNASNACPVESEERAGGAALLDMQDTDIDSDQPPKARQQRFLVISRHDYGSRRKANVHFIARELAQLGPTRFFSSSFSLLSRLKGDHRLPLWRAANKVRSADGVEAYLWRTLLHPCKLSAAFAPVMDRYFRAYANATPKIVQQWIADSDVVLLESGGPEIFFDLVRRVNPNCRLIYICSDSLDAIGCASQVFETFHRIASQFDGIRVPSWRLATAFPQGCQLYFVPHGIDAPALATSAPSPYRGGVNVVSVGNMLFDPSFFEVAARDCPDVNFHVIGGGSKADRLSAPNISVLPETPFAETLPFLMHADAGIAPYGGSVPDYLADTSMKLMQYAFYGLPTVCPASIVGNDSERFGYEPACPETIAPAVRAALRHGRSAGRSHLSWAEVVRRLLTPEDFPDTAMPQNVAARSSA